jgi:cbb3-type cytochrome c oxidase subunit III
MSDFTSNFWSLYVGGITIVSILACALLLWFSGKAKAMTANDNTTGHVWDGDLREMNNPLPRWWVWLFVITIIFALAYLVMYPGAGAFKGQLAWSSTGQYDKGSCGGQQGNRAAVCQVQRHDAGTIGGRPEGHGHWRAPVHEQLRAVPRL